LSSNADPADVALEEDLRIEQFGSAKHKRPPGTQRGQGALRAVVRSALPTTAKLADATEGLDVSRRDGVRRQPTRGVQQLGASTPTAGGMRAARGVNAPVPQPFRYPSGRSESVPDMIRSSGFPPPPAGGSAPAQ
jgi:hypothetical protein